MRIISAFALFAFWLILSASYDVAHVVAGAFFAGIVVWLNPPPATTHKVSWLAALRYLVWLTGRILTSAFHVSRIILDPALPISPRFIRHQTKLRSDGELSVLGNSITLTPGTITVEVAPGELVVHAIDEASSTDLIDGVFDAKVSSIFTAEESAR